MTFSKVMPMFKSSVFLCFVAALILKLGCQTPQEDKKASLDKDIIVQKHILQLCANSEFELLYDKEAGIERTVKAIFTSEKNPDGQIGAKNAATRKIVLPTILPLYMNINDSLRAKFEKTDSLKIYLSKYFAALMVESWVKIYWDFISPVNNWYNYTFERVDDTFFLKLSCSFEHLYRYSGWGGKAGFNTDIRYQLDEFFKENYITAEQRIPFQSLIQSWMQFNSFSHIVLNESDIVLS